MKTLALALASTLVAGPAFAGVYVNVENNAGFTGADYTGAVTDFHVGYEGGTDTFGFYVQGGPAVVTVDGADESDNRISGKVGAIPLVVRIANGRLQPFPFFTPYIVVAVGFQVVFRKDMEKRGLAVFAQRNHRWYACPAPFRVPNLAILP